MNYKNDKTPIIMLLAASTLWGVTGIFVRTLESLGLTTIDMVFFRSFVTALIMFFFLLITDKEKLKINIKDWWYFLGTGVISFLFFGFCYFYTIMHASMSIAAILLYTSPFFVILLARIFFKEKITANKVTGLILAVIGCFLICYTDKNIKVTPIVILTGLASGLCYALYSIFGRVALKKYSSSTVTFYTFLFALAGCLFVTDFPTMISSLKTSPIILPLAGLFAVISAVLPYTFYTVGLKHTETGKASIIATFEAVVACISGIIVYKERLSIAGLVGIILVILAIALLNRKHQ